MRQVFYTLRFWHIQRRGGESKLAVVRADFIKNQQVQAVLDLQIIAQRSFSYVHAAQQVDTVIIEFIKRDTYAVFLHIRLGKQQTCQVCCQTFQLFAGGIIGKADGKTP